MMRPVYSLAMHLALPLVLHRLKKRAKVAPAYAERWQERFGRYGTRFSQSPPFSTSTNGPLWVHAVSVGETVAIAPFIHRLLENDPEQTLVMTTMTPTGAEQVAQRFRQWIAQGRLVHVYCPYDYPWAYQRFLGQFSPSACLLVETELWPNLIYSCQRHQLPVVVANARLSEKSAKGYGKVAWLTKPMLQGVSHIAAQDAESAERFIDLGADAKSVSVMGSIKYDLDLPETLNEQAALLRNTWGAERVVVVAASTHEGEESLLLEACQQLKAQGFPVLLAIVPRHPERFDHVAELIEAQGLSFIRRTHQLANVASEVETPNLDSTVDVYLGDTMGELLSFFAAGDIAVMGGSFIERGGHNPLEPAALSKPVIMGPSTYNFTDVCARLSAENALLTLTSSQLDELVNVLADLLSSTEKRQDMGVAGSAVVAQNKGALQRLMGIVQPLLS